MTHYVILCDWAVTQNCIDCGVNITGVAHSLDEAKEIFAKAIADEREYAKQNNWIVYKDSDVEFDAGEDGFYIQEHAHFYIEEVI